MGNEAVEFCPICRAKTWHVDGVCEWSDGHRKGEASITCPRCGLTSYHPKDIEEGYCGACHDWTREPSAKLA